MINVYKCSNPETRLKKEDEEAKALYIEKQEAFARLKEINRQLRVLSERIPEAVEQARTEIPLRKAPGRLKQVQIVKSLNRTA
jgi:hypothetical protein